jgi:hypothetical protein
MQRERRMMIEAEQVYAAYTQEDFLDVVEGLGDYLEEDHPARVEARSLLWTYNSHFPLDLLSKQEDWERWYAEQMEMLKQEGRGDYYDSLAEWWVATPCKEPLVIAQGMDRQWYVWDGNHRVGISAMKGQKQAPAFVGMQ